MGQIIDWLTQPFRYMLNGLLWNTLMAPLLNVVNGFGMIFQYCSTGLTSQLIFGNNDYEFKYNNVPAPFFAMILAMFVMIAIIFFVQYFQLGFNADINPKERLVKSLKGTGKAMIVVVLMPFIFFAFNIILTIAIKMIYAAFGMSNGSFADAIYRSADFADPKGYTGSIPKYYFVPDPLNMDKFSVLTGIIMGIVMFLGLLGLTISVLKLSLELFVLFCVSPVAAGTIVADDGATFKKFTDASIGRFKTFANVNLGFCAGVLAYPVMMTFGRSIPVMKYGEGILNMAWAIIVTVTTYKVLVATPNMLASIWGGEQVEDGLKEVAKLAGMAVTGAAIGGMALQHVGSKLGNKLAGSAGGQNLAAAPVGGAGDNGAPIMDAPVSPNGGGGPNVNVGGGVNMTASDMPKGTPTNGGVNPDGTTANNSTGSNWDNYHNVRDYNAADATPEDQFDESSDFAKVASGLQQRDYNEGKTLFKGTSFMGKAIQMAKMGPLKAAAAGFGGGIRGIRALKEGVGARKENVARRDAQRMLHGKPGKVYKNTAINRKKGRVGHAKLDKHGVQKGKQTAAQVQEAFDKKTEKKAAKFLKKEQKAQAKGNTNKAQAAHERATEIRNSRYTQKASAQRDANKQSTHHVGRNLKQTATYNNLKAEKGEDFANQYAQDHGFTYTNKSKSSRAKRAEKKMNGEK